MDFLNRITRLVDYLEKNLTHEISAREISRIVCCDVYQFGRIFAYVAGISLSEYLRRRRLSQAALDLQEGNGRVLDVALRYGYQSSSAFTRAFREMHGVSPRTACAPGVRLQMYPPLSFHMTIKGAEEMEYRIEKMPEITCVGVVKNFGRYSPDPSRENWQEQSGAVWDFWDEFLNRGANLILRDKYRLYRPPFWQVGYTRTTEKGETVLAIGAEAKDRIYPELMQFVIPAATWAVFPARGALIHDVHPVTPVLLKALEEWMPASGYEQAGAFSLEVYGPGDTSREDYLTELWIPVIKAAPSKISGF